MSDAKYQIKKVKPGVPDIMTLHEGSDTKLYGPSQGINVWAIPYGTRGMGHKYNRIIDFICTDALGANLYLFKCKWPK